MVERITEAFKKRTGRAAIIPFLSAGDPDFEASYHMFRTVLERGADVVEIGIPYSDPLADGPVIQAASLRSIGAGFSLPRAFELTAKVRKETEKGLVLFTYINPILQYGMERFLADAKSAGADGVIVPDLPLEESSELRRLADAAGIALIPLVTPTSGETRIAAIAREARGFVYCVSSLGVTGERAKMSTRVQNLVETARAHSSLPVAVGFGVSTAEQARSLANFADGVIVGSAYIRRIESALTEESRSPEERTNTLIERVGTFTEALVHAVR